MTHYMKPASQPLPPSRFFNSSINGGATEVSLVWEPLTSNRRESEVTDLKVLTRSATHQAGVSQNKVQRGWG